MSTMEVLVGLYEEIFANVILFFSQQALMVCYMQYALCIVRDITNASTTNLWMCYYVVTSAVKTSEVDSLESCARAIIISIILQ